MCANDAGELAFEAILATLEAAHAGEQPVVEGLRDRKKRRLRQRISDIATALFLADGFDSVSVARIAAVCDVSEQTVFNYFPTKESMFFDRIESSTDAIAEAIRSQPDAPLRQIVLGVLFADDSLERPRGVEHADALRLFRRFCDVAQGSPTLRAAPYLDMERFTGVVGRALAQRVGKEPDDAEVILTAIVIAGLSHLRTQSTYRHIQTKASMAAAHRAVRTDILQAFRIATPALEAFDRADDTSAAAEKR